jgi:hypothetical protein
VNPLRAPANLVDHLVDRTRVTDAMLVNHDRRRWWFVAVTDLTLFVLAVVSWALWPLTHDTWWGIAGGCLIGVQLGRSGICALRRANAYRSGWLRGRSQMVYALAEAQRRGMSPQDWLEGELLRDWAVLGIDPETMPDQKD